MFLRWERGDKGGIREERLPGRGSGGLTPPCCAPPPHPFPLCLWVHVSVWVCVRTSPVPSPPQIPTPRPLIAAIPVAAGCHSAVTPLPIVFRGGKEGELEGRSPSQPCPCPPPPPLPEVPAVVRVGVTVFCDNHSVGELATRQALHGFLAVKHRGELHEDLWEQDAGCEDQGLPASKDAPVHSQQPAASTQTQNSAGGRERERA